MYSKRINRIPSQMLAGNETLMCSKKLVLFLGLAKRNWLTKRSYGAA
jgi:hypothetical protein